jgi:hypothetical protein
MALPEHGREWMHPQGGERYFLEHLPGTSAVFGLASGPGPDRASFLFLRSGPLEFALLCVD